MKNTIMSLLSRLLLLTTTAAVTAAPVIQERSIPSGVPDFVVKYAPVVYLFSEEAYFPSDIGAQVANTAPAINRTLVPNPPDVTLEDLDQLNDLPDSNNGEDVYLTSREDPTANPRPEFLYGVRPDAEGKTEDAVSCAVIVFDHDNGTVDAFYMYFYAFDFGGVYFGLNVGNHVGDWEHNMLRFTSSQPQAMWYSQHSSGEAFSYTATEKHDSIRPVTYSANGTHANYATSGTHDHTIPGINLPAGPIEDHTDAGYLWDPTRNAYYYSYSPSTGIFSAYGDAPTGWLNFNGRWGDDKIPEDDSRQDCYFGIDALCQYTAGPTGPKDKDLDRTNVCPDDDDHCIVLPVLVPRGV